MHKNHTIMNEVNIQSFWSETKMDAGFKRFDQTVPCTEYYTLEER